MIASRRIFFCSRDDDIQKIGICSVYRFYIFYKGLGNIFLYFIYLYLIEVFFVYVYTESMSTLSLFFILQSDKKV